MARPLDPFRTLEVPRDATLDEVKAAYRRLAKLYHPDSAGDRAVTRFLAIQAAYEALTEGTAVLRLGTRPRSRPAAGRATRPSEADAERARATREAAGRAGRTRQSTGAAGSPHAAGGPSAAGTPGAAGTERDAPRGSGAARGGPGRAKAGSAGRVRRDKRRPNSTSYDGADLEPFEPEWQGASWYGESSGTYWTINPKEFADPRKHGPEYQARGRRVARADRADGRPASAGAAGAARGAPVAPSGPARSAESDQRGGPAQPTPWPAGATDEVPAAASREFAAAPQPGWPGGADVDPGDGAAPPVHSIAWEPPDGPPEGGGAGDTRPPFAVLGVFGIMLAAIGTILFLSPAGPASAAFVPVIFLVALLATAGLVLGGLARRRRA